MAAAGRSWRTYAQDYPATSGCHTAATYSGVLDGPGVAGTYARKHNPAMSFTSVSGTSQCANIQPLAKFDPSVNVAFVVPNLCNDAHDCSLATADAFLKGFVPKVTGSADWAHTLLVVSFDEGSTSTERRRPDLHRRHPPGPVQGRLDDDPHPLQPAADDREPQRPALSRQLLQREHAERVPALTRGLGSRPA